MVDGLSRGPDLLPEPMSRKRWLFTLTAAALVLVALALPALYPRGRAAESERPWARVPAPPRHSARASATRASSPRSSTCTT